MTERNLEFLDYILLKLNENYPDGDSINSLAHKYKKDTGKIFDYKDQNHFQELYDNKYFTNNGNGSYLVITAETKEKIDTYGSLSNYFEEENNLNQSNQKEDEELKKLQTDNLKLQNENLVLQNKHIKRYVLYALVSFIIGAIVTNIKDILILLDILKSE
jgi:hypothetical protein